MKKDYTPDVLKQETRAARSYAETIDKRNFKRFKDQHPNLKYGDVLIVTETALKMKGGQIYRLDDNEEGRR